MGKPYQPRKAKGKAVVVKAVVVDNEETNDISVDPQYLAELVVTKKLRLLTEKNQDLVENVPGPSTSMTTVTTGRKLSRKERNQRQKDYVHKENIDEYRDFRIDPPPGAKTLYATDFFNEDDGKFFTFFDFFPGFYSAKKREL